MAAEDLRGSGVRLVHRSLPVLVGGVAGAGRWSRRGSRGPGGHCDSWLGGIRSGCGDVRGHCAPWGTWGRRDHWAVPRGLGGRWAPWDRVARWFCCGRWDCQDRRDRHDQRGCSAARARLTRAGQACLLGPAATHRAGGACTRRSPCPWKSSGARPVPVSRDLRCAPRGAAACRTPARSAPVPRCLRFRPTEAAAHWVGPVSNLRPGTRHQGRENPPARSSRRMLRCRCDRYLPPRRRPSGRNPTRRTRRP